MQWNLESWPPVGIVTFQQTCMGAVMIYNMFVCSDKDTQRLQQLIYQHKVTELFVRYTRTLFNS